METTSPSAEITVYSPLFPPFRQPLDVTSVSIGRASECTIPVRDRYLSRKHAEIVLVDGRWLLRDCGSANGTYLNGRRVEADTVLTSGDRIRLGDTELVFEAEHRTDRFLAVPDSRVSPTIAIPVQEIYRVDSDTADLTKLRMLTMLAMELIEDRPMDQLFGFILDRVMDHLKPSRAAFGLLAGDGRSFVTVEVRRQDAGDESELAISQTLLSQVVKEKKALAFMDVGGDEKLSRAHSIVAQGIHSVLCAPVMIASSVVGVLYVDFLFTQHSISEDDVKLIAQIARFAATKLETTRLREDALQKRLMDEELRTASVIQQRLLPAAPDRIDGYTFHGLNRPCRSVSGDYYDFVARPDGRIYFVIGDVSGKGVTAALLMAGLQAAFRIFAKSDPAPAELVTQLNVALKENLPQSKFVTLFLGRLDTKNGIVEYANAGHLPPLLVRRDEVRELDETDMVLGVVPRADYHDRRIALMPGESLVLFTDGVTEAQDPEGRDLGSELLAAALKGSWGTGAAAIGQRVESTVMQHVAETPLGDDVTLMVVSRNL